MSFMKTALGKILENMEGADNICLKSFSLMLQNLHYKYRSLKFTFFVQQLYIFQITLIWSEETMKVSAADFGN